MEMILSLLIALVVVFAAAQLFTNALEHIGERMGLSEGVTGSIFAAVGTAMPETIVPIVTILAGGATEAINQEVGLGAILGAPFMLATLSIALMGIFAGYKHGWNIKFKPESTGLNRDIQVFYIGYGLVILAALLPEAWQNTRILIAAALFVLYFLYLMRTIRASSQLVADGHHTEAEEPLYFSRFLNDSNLVTTFQLLVGLALLIWGARLFVHGVEMASDIMGISALILSLLVVPIATELPEKVNSILWIRRRRDTLAFGNITGAMVFQGTIIPGIGILLMPWVLNDVFAAMAVALALAGNAWLWLLLRSGRLTPKLVSLNVIFYAIFMAFVVFY